MTSSASPRPAPSQALVSAVYFLFLFMAYSLILRVSDFIVLAMSGNVSLSPLGPPFTLPFILGEELAIGLVIALVLFAAWRNFVARGIVIGIISLYMVFLAFDQLAFKLFFGHVDYVLYATSHDIERLSGSIEGAFDVFFALHATIAIVCGALLIVRARPQFIRGFAQIVRRRSVLAISIFVAYASVHAILVSVADQRGLDRSFPVAYASSYLQAARQAAEDARALAKTDPNSKNLARPLFGGGKKGERPRLDAGVAVKPLKKLNVVWYFMESAAFRETSLNPKNEYDTTPFIKELADKSLVFTNYYTGFAASTRSFFSALHGLYPYVDQSPDVTKYSRLGIPNLVSILKKEGYATGFFTSSDSLFDSLDTLIAALPYDKYLDKNLLLKEDPQNVSIGSWGVEEEAMIDKTLEWIAEIKDSGEPFLVSYNAVYPHHPFDVPKQHAALYDMDWGDDGLKSRFRASLHYADMSVRRFYEGLERLGLLEDTLFIVTSDHGETFGDVHRNNLIHAEFCYDEDSHIFLVLHNPETLGKPLVDERLGSHADFLPTVLAVLGIKKDLSDIDGQSLISKNYEERMIFCCSRRGLGVRDSNFKFVTLKSGGRPELYNLAEDPDEQNDISRANPEKTQAYEKVVRDWRVSVLRAYRDRHQEAGLSEKEISSLARQERNKLFAGLRAHLAGVAICLSGNRSSCSAAGKSPSFSKGSSLAIQARVQKPGRLGLQVDVFGPSGKKISKIKTAHQHTAGPLYADLPGSLFQEPGRYRARVVLLSSHAAHDSAAIYFNIKE